MSTTSTLPALDFGKTNLAYAQSQCAQITKSMLSACKDWGELQSSIGIKLMHGILGAQQPGAATLSMQNLLGLPFELTGDLAAQQKGAMQGYLQRYKTLIEDLGKSQTKDDISLVLVGYMSDLDGMARDNGSKVMTLLNSSSAATSVLTERTLDDLIAAGPQPRLPLPA